MLITPMIRLLLILLGVFSLVLARPDDGNTASDSTIQSNADNLGTTENSGDESDTVKNSPPTSVTQKPSNSSFVSGPWIYPRPTTTKPSTTTSKSEVENLGSENDNTGSESNSTSESEESNENSNSTSESEESNENSNSTSESDESNEDHSNASELNDSDENSSSESIELEINTEIINSNDSPSIPVTQKPGNPSYVPDPWIYPKPIEPIQSTTIKPLVEDLGNTGSESNEPEKSDDTGSNSGNIGTLPNVPSISATQKPQCPSYVSCPWIYPKPTTESSITTSTTIKPIVEYLGPANSGSIEVSESSNNGNTGTGSSGNGPSISATQKPPFPSVVSGPWIYPRPFNEIISQNGTISTTTLKPVVEYLGTDNASNSGPEPSDSENDNSGTDNSSHGPSISATQKPVYPSYVPGPWVYPKPINEITSQNGTTSTTTLKPVVEYLGTENASEGDSSNNGNNGSESSNSSNNANSETNNSGNGPSISATQKPQYPSYVPGPWVYPKPFNETPAENDTTSATTTLKPIVDYFGTDNGNSGSEPNDSSNNGNSGSVPSISSNNNESESSSSSSNANSGTDNSDHGPSISATQKPVYPSYVPGPWVYPKPFNEQSAENDTTLATTTLKPVVEYFGTDNGNSGSETSDSSNNGNNGSKSNNSSNNANSETDNSGNGLSISATQKPQYPSYIPGPWVYPKPFNETPAQNDSTSATTTVKAIAEYFGTDNADNNVPELSDPPKDFNTVTGNSGSGPSISATKKPPFPSYVSGPWVYPKPFNEISPNGITSTTTPKPVVEYFGTDDVGNNGSETSDLSNNGNGNGNSGTSNSGSGPSGSGPSISATQKPQCPSYVSCPWIYPKPTTRMPTEISTTTTTIKPLVEYLGTDNNDNGGTGPSISATQKPQKPSFVSGPVVYPKPSNEKTTLKPLVEYLGTDNTDNGGTGPSISATQKPQKPSFVSGPVVYPKPSNEKTTLKPLVEYFGGENSETHSSTMAQWEFPGPTTRYPSKQPIKPTKKLGINHTPTVSSLKNSQNTPTIIQTPWGPISVNPIGNVVTEFPPIANRDNDGLNLEGSDDMDSIISDIIGSYATYYYGVDPSISNAPKQSQNPSYLSDLWVYPKPIGIDNIPDNTPSTTSSPLKQYFGTDIIGSSVYKPSGNAYIYVYGNGGQPYSSGPSILQGQKPYRPSYLPNAWIYPLPFIQSKPSNNK